MSQDLGLIPITKVARIEQFKDDINAKGELDLAFNLLLELDLPDNLLPFYDPTIDISLIALDSNIQEKILI